MKLTLANLLDVARQLVAQRVFDGEVVLELLSQLHSYGLDVQATGAVAHARLIVLGELETSVQVATARFALARVVTLLEQKLRSTFRVVD